MWRINTWGWQPALVVQLTGPYYKMEHRGRATPPLIRRIWRRGGARCSVDVLSGLRADVDAGVADRPARHRHPVSRRCAQCVFSCGGQLGAAITSLYALGYGRHEEAPARVLPFYCAFLAGMNFVVFADDAFTFLLAWECDRESAKGSATGCRRWTGRQQHAA
jgi:hypothetical protein